MNYLNAIDCYNRVLILIIKMYFTIHEFKIVGKQSQLN